MLDYPVGKSVRRLFGVRVRERRETVTDHCEGHDCRVGDIDLADHVGAIGIWCELDAEGCHVEALELV